MPPIQRAWKTCRLVLTFAESSVSPELIKSLIARLIDVATATVSLADNRKRATEVALLIGGDPEGGEHAYQAALAIMADPEALTKLDPAAPSVVGMRASEEASVPPSGLSAGAVAGIVIGVLLVVAIVAIVAIYFLILRNRKAPIVEDIEMRSDVETCSDLEMHSHGLRPNPYQGAASPATPRRFTEQFRRGEEIVEVHQADLYDEE
jgi:hypothetical protein